MSSYSFSVIAEAKHILEEAKQEVENLKNQLDTDFEKAVDAILTCKGRIVFTGIGKSAIIAQKLVATFNSTGTPALFMHAADAIHGDIGLVQKDDLVVMISNSGNTPEIKVLIPLIKLRGNTIIAMSGNPDSYLAKNSDFLINTHVRKEIYEDNLVPTSSSLIQLLIGDTIALILLKIKGFSKEDFARFHPGGDIGKRIYLKVSDLIKNNQKPQVKPHSSIKEVIIEISTKRLGAAVVLDENNEIKGIITDGDIRRMLQNNDKIDNLKASDVMSKNPKTIDYTTLAADALRIMETHNITQLIVTENNSYLGIVHLHDILKEGIL